MYLDFQAHEDKPSTPAFSPVDTDSDAESTASQSAGSQSASPLPSRKSTLTASMSLPELSQRAVELQQHGMHRELQRGPFSASFSNTRTIANALSVANGGRRRNRKPTLMLWTRMEVNSINYLQLLKAVW